MFPPNKKRTAFVDPRKDSTHRAIGPFLFIAQIVGVLPLKNILKYSAGANGFSFKWLSVRSIFATVLICLSFCQLSLFTWRMVNDGFSAGGFTAIVFFSSTMSTAGLMLHLAASGRFRRLMMVFEKSDEIFTSDSYRIPNKWTLRRKIMTLTSILVSLAIVEHLMYLMAKMTNVWSQIKKCKFNISLYEHFLRTERRHLYAVIPFNYFIAIPFEITNVCNTFAWTLLDLTIMILSIALAHRFQQISRRIKSILIQSMPDDFWTEIRGHYIVLQELVASVDKCFSYLILLSCVTDVYFTCFLLFQSFGDIPETLNALYFKFSISFIISRTLATLYFATTVHEAAAGPKVLVKSVPHQAWGPEVERFAYQLSNETVALSGKGFFYFTRNVILTLLGTIMTYELVMVDQILEAPEIVQKTCHVVYNMSEVTN